MSRLAAFYELVRGRRSIRVYDRSVGVSREALVRVLEAACWAPSAHNAQPWRFILVEDSEVRERLVEAMAEVWLEDLRRDGVPEERALEIVEAECRRRFTDAPVLILVCLSMEDMDRYPDRRRMEAEHLMGVQSVAAAVENLLLAAHAEGLGACWVCAPLFCQDAVREALRLPVGFEPQAIITLGYPAEKPQPPSRKPLSKLVYTVSPGGGLDPWSF